MNYFTIITGPTVINQNHAIKFTVIAVSPIINQIHRYHFLSTNDSCKCSQKKVHKLKFMNSEITSVRYHDSLSW